MRLVRHRHHGIQLAKAFGSKVIVTVGGQDKVDACLKLGADRAINYKTEDFVAEVKTATAGAGANVILDMSPATTSTAITTLPLSMAVSCRSPPNGAKVTVNMPSDGEAADPHCSTLRPRTNADKAAMVAAIEANGDPLMREGRVNR